MTVDSTRQGDGEARGAPQELWSRVDDYLSDLLAPSDEVLDAALGASETAGLPAINVARNQGRMLQVLVAATGARRILEIGTLGGYSTIHLARALPPGGRVVTLERSPRHAEVARENLARAGLAEVVEVRVGAAVDSLAALASEGAEPFDLVFIDADKESYPEYLEWAVRLARLGALLVADNVVRSGSVADPAADDAGTVAIRRFHEVLGADPRLLATAVQTVGHKGHDGFALAVVTGAR
ncbi:MAG: O-methyltransferase [Actinomycetota bacterium]|nr:O-methyltransferase [Actinomycetota bacterium]